MKTRNIGIVLALLVLTAINAALFLLRDPPPATATGGERIGDFALLDHRGHFHQLYRYGHKQAVVLYIYGVGCPVARATAPELKRLRGQYEAHNVTFLLVDANPQDSREAIRADMEKLGITLPVLRDEAQLLIEHLNITRTGEAIVVEPETWEIKYRGPVDDRLHYEVQKPEATRRYVAEVLDAMLAGQAVPVDAPTGAGCLISPLQSQAASHETVSYARDIVPILQARCMQCHRPGGIGPWSMDSYETVRGWTSMMREVVMNRRMPPWGADPEVGAFSSDLSLSVDEMRKLIHWIDKGAPHDGPDDPLASQPADALPKWPLGEPDMIVSVPRQEVPAEGAIEYRYLDVPLNLERDVWVRAAYLMPSRPEVMHHALSFIIYPERLKAYQPDYSKGLGTFFSGYHPGQDTFPYPEDSGIWIPAGSSIRFQLHYNAIGHSTSDEPELALYFHDSLPEREFVVNSAYNARFRIPPHAANHPVRARKAITKDVRLYGLMPHMHFRGRWFRMDVELPDGTRRPLLSVPNYHFNWQHLYQLATPMDIPAGSTIIATGGFDNSRHNPANPDPSSEVRWGRQSWDEMLIGYFFFTRELGDHPARQAHASR